MKKIIKNKKVIVVSGERKKEAAQAINFVLKERYSVFWSKGLPSFLQFFSVLGKKIIIIEDDLNLNPQEVKNIVSHNSLLLITETKNKAKIKKFLVGFPQKGFLVIDFSVARRLKGRKFEKMLTFGVGKKNADFYVSDIARGEKETNFKINYKGNIIPFWVKGQPKKKEIYGILSALCIGEIFRINLADMSQRMRDNFYFTAR